MSSMVINPVSPGGYELYLYFVSIPYGAKHEKYFLLTADHFAPLTVVFCLSLCPSTFGNFVTYDCVKSLNVRQHLWGKIVCPPREKPTVLVFHCCSKQITMFLVAENNTNISSCSSGTRTPKMGLTGLRSCKHGCVSLWRL